MITVAEVLDDLSALSPVTQEDDDETISMQRQESEEVVNDRPERPPPGGGQGGQDPPGVMSAEDGISQLASVSHELSEERDALFLLGDTSIDGSGNKSHNYIEGNAGDNLLEGNGGNDWLWGDDGEDTLIGGAGSDLMVGGADADVFVLDDSVVLDFIADFSVSEGDKIRIVASEFGIEVTAYELFEFDSTNQVLRLEGNAIAMFGSNSDLSGISSVEAAIELV